jgi:hypothetical protein
MRVCLSATVDWRDWRIDSVVLDDLVCQDRATVSPEDTIHNDRLRNWILKLPVPSNSKKPTVEKYRLELNAIKQYRRWSNRWKDYDLTVWPCFLNSSAIRLLLKGEALCKSIVRTFGYQFDGERKIFLFHSSFWMLQSGINFRCSLGDRLDEFLLPNW